MTKEEIRRHMAEINAMSHRQMARLYHFASPGHIYFDSRLPFNEVFKKRFKELGGMTPSISKEIGLTKTG